MFLFKFSENYEAMPYVNVEMPLINHDAPKTKAFVK